MKYTVKKILISSYRDYFEDSDYDYFEDAVGSLENIASVFSMLSNLNEPRVQSYLDDLADDLKGFVDTLEKQASKIDELEDDLRWAETEKEEAETEQERLEDRLDELKRLPESILNHFDRNPHLMDDLRNLAAALRFDNQHANAELIAQTVSVLESIQITAARFMSDLFNIPNIMDDESTAHAVGDMAQAMLMKLSPVDHGKITYCLLELYYSLAVSTVHPARTLNENGKTVFAALGEIFNRAGISISLTSNTNYEI